MYNIALAVKRDLYGQLFSTPDVQRILQVGEFLNEPADEVTRELLLKWVADADIVITSWRTPQLDRDIIAAGSQIKLVTHAAGSVKPIVCDELWDRGIRVTSAAAAIAPGVAEFCIGMALLASRRAFWMADSMRSGHWHDLMNCFGGGFELYQQNIGIIGASHVGKELIRLFKSYTCNIYLYDPYCSATQADDLGVTLVDDLDTLFSSCRVVSLNAPATDETRHMLRGSQFEKLQDGSVFINTARPAIIHEPEFIEQLRLGRFVACIDVTDPEPCPMDHPFRSLPNVILTPHIAGAKHENKRLIGTYVANEIEAFAANRPLHYEITGDMSASA